jgi:ferredoxin
MKATWHLPDGRTVTADVKEGQSLMEAAVLLNIPHVTGDCGGNTSCVKCYVSVDSAWFGATGTSDRSEDSLRDVAGAECTQTLRLICALLCPLGVSKHVVSTVSFSPMIPPERLAADIQIMLFADGFYGRNSVCKASRPQAAGAVLGAVRAIGPPTRTKPLISMTSFGKTMLRYLVSLKPALEALAAMNGIGLMGRCAMPKAWPSFTPKSTPIFRAMCIWQTWTPTSTMPPLQRPS